MAQATIICKYMQNIYLKRLILVVQKYDLNEITPTNAPQKRDGKLLGNIFYWVPIP
jgi:hypothetical protein